MSVLNEGYVNHSSIIKKIQRQTSILELADKGEQIGIKRRGKVSYVLTPVEDSDFIITPELEQRIEKGRIVYKERKTTSCGAKEAVKFF